MAKDKKNDIISFLDETKEISLKAFEEKESNKILIEDLKESIKKSAAKGAFIYRCNNTNLSRYFCLKYGFKSVGAFLSL